MIYFRLSVFNDKYSNIKLVLIASWLLAVNVYQTSDIL